MTKQTFVGFTGYAGAGKDFVADAVELAIHRNVAVEKVPWARGVREEIEEAVLGYADGEGGILDRLYQKPTDTEMIRPLLQWWGTDFRREQDPDYWVKWGLKAASESDAHVILFTDTRFPNEVEAIQRAGGFVVNVCAHKSVREERIGKTPAHASEEPERLPWDIRIWNNGEGTLHHFGTFKAIIDRIKEEVRNG